MASSSAPAPSWKYDVFLSFRGEDTRTNFVSFIHRELRRYGIKTFIDDRLRRGDQISPVLLQAIEDSRFSIVVFSENYASSSWCLDELTKILECVDEMGHTAFPVFYEVDPSHVRKQKGSYAEAFKKHDEAHRNNTEKVDKWRKALTKASNYSGFPTKDKDQSEVIREIVSNLLNKIPASPSSSNMIGMESPVDTMLSLLQIESDDVRMVGIWGMAGIGKTTLAEAICQKIYTQFEGHCLLSNVRKKSMENLQMELLSKTLPEEEQLIRNLGLDSIKIAFSSLKVLIVLDDVDHINQLEGLVGQYDWFGQGSRIIITTRDMGLLKDMDEVYEATKLQKEEALSLFCLHTFKDKLPLQDFEELCVSFLDYAKGNPLVIKTLGRHLYKRTKEEWECELEKLKKIPNKDVQDVLRISFDGLEDKVKNIFLDIACFLKGEDKDYASELLKCFDFYPKIAIRTLVERALITIADDNRLCMHDLIQEMGWEIVRQESTEYPGERSRLWLNDDVRHVLTTNSGTKTIQGIVLDLSASKELLDFKGDAFKKMIKLRWLEIRIFEKCLYDFGRLTSPAPLRMHLRGDLKFQSQLLGYLRWEGYPLKSLPSNFDSRKLFELNMRFSRLKKLCKGKKSFENLVYMNLSYSRDLIRTPDLSEAPKLRKIYLEGCTSLVEIHLSIENLENLSFLNLRHCSKLEKVAESFSKLTSLESVDFSNCSNLRNLPKDFRISSPYLDLSGCSKLEELLETISKLTSLVSLNLSDCSQLVELPESIGQLTSLKTLNISGCSKLGKLPESIGKLIALETLNLAGCSKLGKLPESIGKLTSLETLTLDNCPKLGELPESIDELTSLRTLNLIGCSELKKLPNSVGRLQRLVKVVADGSGIQEVPHSIGLFTRLKELSLRGGKIGGSSINKDLSYLISSSPKQGFLQPIMKSLKLRDCNLQEVGNISSLCSLQFLDLSGNSFTSLPSLTPLTCLLELRLEDCKILRALKELPLRIETICASNCESLETFSHPPNSYSNSKTREFKFDFSNCGQLQEKKESLTAILDGIRIFPWFCEHRRFGALVPGRSVPKWFIHRSMGNSIIVKLPPYFQDLEDVGLGFCAVLGQNYSNHLWFGYDALISDKTFSKCVTHLKFSFPQEVKEFGIRLLYLPRYFKTWGRSPWPEDDAFERMTVNATFVSPPPTLIFNEECCWKTTITAKHPKYIYPAQTKLSDKVILWAKMVKKRGLTGHKEKRSSMPI